LGDNPIALHGNQLVLYNETEIEQGQIILDQAPNAIAAYENSVFSFLIENNSVQISITDVSTFSLPQPGEPVDPIGHGSFEKKKNSERKPPLMQRRFLLKNIERKVIKMSGVFRSFEKNSRVICRKGSGKSAVLMAVQPIYFLTKPLLTQPTESSNLHLNYC